MCLGIPGKICTVYDDSGVKMGKVDFGGVSRTVCLAYVPEASPGKYVIVHAGFAISLVDEDEAQRTLALWHEIQAAEAEEE